MKCKECYCVSEVEENIYGDNCKYYGKKFVSDCERYGKCWLGEETLECPEEQLEEFKVTENEDNSSRRPRLR